MPLPLVRRSCGRPRPLAIDQPCHRANAGSMLLPMIPIHLCYRLIPPHPSNTMLHHDPPLGKRPVVLDVIGRTLFAARFLARRCPQSRRVQFVDAYICQISDPADAFRQPLSSPDSSKTLMSAVGPRVLSAMSTICPVSSSTATWLFIVWRFFLPL